ncbi:MAG: DnaA/Hda family protein [Planctomycetota bacterium]
MAVKATADRIHRIPLAKPATVRKQLSHLDTEGWLIEDFVAGPENASLLHPFQDETLQSLQLISPVVFYGENASGKTALGISLAVHWSRVHHRRGLTFSTGTAFAREYAAAIEMDDLPPFRKKFRECNLLLIDDLDALRKKSAAQQELVHALDALGEQGVATIFTCSKLPASVEGFLPALTSRLSGGLSVAIQKPDLPAIEVIVDALCKKIDRQLDPIALCEFIGKLQRRLSVPDLQAICTIAHQNRTMNGRTDFAIIGSLVRQYFGTNALTMPVIAKTVAKSLRVRLSDMRGSTRQANIVRARGLAIVLARRLTSISLQEIGSFFGGRDHSTVLHALRKTTELLDQDKELAKALSHIQADLLR